MAPASNKQSAEKPTIPCLFYDLNHKWTTPHFLKVGRSQGDGCSTKQTCGRESVCVRMCEEARAWARRRRGSAGVEIDHMLLATQTQQLLCMRRGVEFKKKKKGDEEKFLLVCRELLMLWVWWLGTGCSSGIHFSFKTDYGNILARDVNC